MFHRVSLQLSEHILYYTVCILWVGAGVGGRFGGMGAYGDDNKINQRFHTWFWNLIYKKYYVPFVM